MVSRTLSRYGILLILLLGFGLRLALATTSLSLPVRADEREYTNIAKVIGANPLHYDGTFRPPTYPFLLAFTFAVAGQARFPSDVVNALLAAVNTAVMYAFAMTLFRRKSVGLVTALLFAISFELIAMARLFYSESLFLLLLCAGFWLVIKAVKQWDWKLAAVAGIVFAVAALTRDVLTLFAMFGIPIWFAILGWRKWRTTLKIFAAFAFGFAVILVPWVIRNATIEHRIVLSSTSGEYVFAHDNAREEKKVGIKPSRVGAIIDKNGSISYQATILSEFRKQPPELRGAWAMNRGLTVIKFAPFKWLLVKAERLRTFFQVVPHTLPYLRLQTLPESWGGAIEFLVATIFIVTLLLAGVGLLTARDNVPKLLILAYILFNLLTFILTHYQPRYRLPLVVLLSPYAAYGVVWLVEWLAGWSPLKLQKQPVETFR